MAMIMAGSRGRQRLTAMQTTSVTSAIPMTYRLIWSSCWNRPSSTRQTEAPRATSTPKKFFTWLITISTAAPVVNPTTTVGETKLTRVPIRNAPSASWNRPTSSVNVSTRPTYSGVPACASGLMVA